MYKVAGLMLKPTATGADTVRFALPVTGPTVAVMVEMPGSPPVAKPEEVIVATAGSEELQVRDDKVRDRVLPSVPVPVAENCNDSPAATFPLAGATAMAASAGGPTT